MTASSAKPIDETAAARPSAAIVFCVEFGALEDQAVLLATSIRRWGRDMADAELYAVRSRWDLPLASRTVKAFEQLGVNIVKASEINPRPWDNYINKPVALIAVEKQSKADVIVWLDTDIFVLGDFADMLPRGEIALSAAPSDKNVGTSGPDDENEPYWRACADAVGVDLEAMPMLTTNRDHATIRMYFNSGVFAFRRDAAFADTFMESCLAITNGKIASRNSGIFFTDQVALALATQKSGLRWRALPTKYNFAMGPKIEPMYQDALLAEARLLHYHNSLWPGYYDVLVERLGKMGFPDQAAVLSEHGPLRIRRSMPMRAINKIKKDRRSRRYGHDLQNSTVY